MWPSGLSARPQTKGSPVQFPLRSHAWVAGQVPCRGHARSNHTLMFPSSFSLPSPLSQNKYINKFQKICKCCSWRAGLIKAGHGLYNLLTHSWYDNILNLASLFLLKGELNILAIKKQILNISNLKSEPRYDWLIEIYGFLTLNKY